MFKILDERQINAKSRLRRAQACLLDAQLLDLQPAHALEAAVPDERDDLVQLARVQKGAVAAAHVHDGA